MGYVSARLGTLSSLLLDTHTAVWYLHEPSRLSPKALQEIHIALTDGTPLFISIISLIELVYLVEKGRIPKDALEDLKKGVHDPLAAIQILPVDPSILEALERIPRGMVPDMPDRIIAASAVHRGLALVTRDRRIRDCGITTLW